MRLLHQDSNTGEIKLYIESLDDLWHLKNLIEPKDLVWANTTRRKEEKGDKIRSERPDKKRMRLAVRVDRVELQEFQDKIRVLGIIEDGPQDLGHHHTLMIGIGDDLSIFKEKWKKHELERIKLALEQSAKPSIYFVAIDDTEVNVFIMSQFSIREIGSAARSGTGKMYESKSNQLEYFEEIRGILANSIDNEPLVILGPGFAKEAFLAYLKEKYPDLAKNASIIASGQTGAAGVSEIIKKGLGGRVLEVSRIAIETKLIEEVLTRIKTDQPVAYGPQSVDRAVTAGAAEILLITEKEARTSQGEQLMRSTERSSGKIEIISTTHDSGKQLESLGGYAALLRYKIEE
ncbi:MAG: mRNA surveillance protein pelota [Thermoplasmata archaeon]|nr:mRNA surveillance protein pelota [Thermoplasmata archaeon]